MMIVTINRNVIASNAKYGRNEPPIRISNGRYGKATYCHEAQLAPGVKLVYRPQDKLPCGARLWIESEGEVEVLN